MYRFFIKRWLDAMLALLALIVLFPLLLFLMILGAVKMKGNPFFRQRRPGKNEKIFHLLKFRTMTDRRDEKGNPLPDDFRLTRYGKFLRSTSLDELPELFNILKGDMAIVGPRPLLVDYLPYYKEEERIRHTVRPGLTGLAQINGRNATSWEERFTWDLRYVQNVSFLGDVKIILGTLKKVVRRSDVLVGSEIPAGRLDHYRRKVNPS
ncbi:Lipid carrier : UDP-N-acetylgalactosaminyltransferase [Clostridiaceae bacterium JG1575]|nr:Lipid carrier : UDP-N-acetylgalactosaminyltransferase [Clostridiaceae bacterium JG1575]